MSDHPGVAKLARLFEPAGLGTVWRAESLWAERVSPWRPLGDVSDDELLAVLRAANRLMRRATDTGRTERQVYRRAGMPCPRCQTLIRSRGQGDDNRTSYWCPACQPGPDPR